MASFALFVENHLPTVLSASPLWYMLFCIVSFHSANLLAPALHAGSAWSAAHPAAHVHYSTPTPSFADEEPGITTDPPSTPTSGRALVAAHALLRDAFDADRRSCGSEGVNSTATILGSPLS